MPYANTPVLLINNTALGIGDNVLDPGAFSPDVFGKLPTSVDVAFRVNSVVTGPVVLRLEYSIDGITWGLADPTQVMTSIAAAGVFSKSFPLQFPRFRIIVNLAAGSAAISCTITAQ